MYRIIKTDGTELGITDSVRYIKIAKNGCFVICPIDEAVGIAYKNEPYNLFGHTEITNRDTVIITECDSGTMVTDQRALINKLILTALEG